MKENDAARKNIKIKRQTFSLKTKREIFLELIKVKRLVI
jgi:hypothetical protein